MAIWHGMAIWDRWHLNSEYPENYNIFQFYSLKLGKKGIALKAYIALLISGYVKKRCVGTMKVLFFRTVIMPDHL